MTTATDDQHDRWDDWATSNGVGSMHDLDANTVLVHLVTTAAKAVAASSEIEWDDDDDPGDGSEVGSLLSDAYAMILGLFDAGLISPCWYSVLDSRGRVVQPRVGL